MAYSTIVKPGDYFNTKLYTGNGSTQSITGVGFQPDFLWIKERSSTSSHTAHDAVRGATKYLTPNTTDVEGTGFVTSFDSDGFTLPVSNLSNQNNETYASWNWKAGTTAIPSGSTTDPLGVSINTTSGFGIYKITSPGSGSYVLKHGLGKKPKMVIVKDLEASQKWMVWSDTFSNLTNDYLQLNDTAAKATYSTCWGTMNSTDCTISVGGTLDANNDHVVYIFTDTTGYSKFGSYTGDGNTNGPFVYTGFKPAFFMTKRTDAGAGWQMYDSTRDVDNPADHRLQAQSNAVELVGDANTDIDFLSNGFNLRNADADSNASGGNYIYMAFAEEPLVANSGTDGVPATAR